MIIDNLTSIEYIFVVAKSSLNDILPGEEFMVKDLFRAFEWNRLDLNIRKDISDAFFDYAINEGRSIISPIGHTETYKQLYKKLA